VTSVNLINNGGVVNFGYDANGNMISGINNTGNPITGNFQAHYDAQNQPFRLARGVQKSEFWYGSDNQRYYQLDELGQWTFYVDKLYEQKGSTLHKLYLGNYGVFTVDVTSAQNTGITYLHKDRLGSIVAMTDKNGAEVLGAGRGFDPFGKPREENWADSDGLDEVPFPNQESGDLNRPDQTTRGFTGHEHLNNVAITHMNGRAYDYNLGRFLSVDPIIQFPANSQSLNPYSYIMNNPLSGTDPTGYSTCAEPTNPDCNSPEEEIKPRDPTGSTTDKCNRGSACTVIRFNGGDSRMSEGDDKNAKETPDNIGANSNRENMEQDRGLSKDKNMSEENISVDSFEPRTDKEELQAFLAKNNLTENDIYTNKDDFYENILKNPKPLVLQEGNKFHVIIIVTGTPPLVGPVKLLKFLIGKSFPTKLNRGGVQQPFNPANGRFLSSNANPGLLLSPLSRFTAGFSHGFAEAFSGVQGGTVVGSAGNIGNTLGKIAGTIASIFGG